jgi:molecular chaperone GrpE
MLRTDDERRTEICEEEEGSMKVPIDDSSADIDEQAMVDAAIKAGEEAAEAELSAEKDSETERLRTERDELAGRLEEAESFLSAAEKQVSEANDRLARLQADWENFRRRTRQEREAERERAAELLVVSLLPVLDDMERAVDHARASEDASEQLLQFVDGVNQVHDKMVMLLGKEGVEVIDAKDAPFDPLAHQAVGREENTEAFDETVAQVYQQGYRMGGKVIRPAMVTVTYGGPKRPAEESADGGEK